jgi:ABC-type sugar transport system ATPase subunit
MRSALLELRNISKSYGSLRVLRGIYLKVREGERIAILGPNGSGKTTLLRIIALLESPDSGEILFRGRVVDQHLASTLRGKITLVFQENVWVSGTVRENLSLGLTFMKLEKDEIERKVLEVARLLKLEGVLDKKIQQLSGGEQKRVCIGRALAIKPEILLLDEPTAWLDKENSALIEKVVKETAKTVIFSTTDPFQAKRLATKTFRLRDGNLLDNR